MPVPVFPNHPLKNKLTSAVNGESVFLFFFIGFKSIDLNLHTISINDKKQMDTSQISEMNIVLVFTSVIFLPVYAITYIFFSKKDFF